VPKDQKWPNKITKDQKNGAFSKIGGEIQKTKIGNCWRIKPISALNIVDKDLNWGRENIIFLRFWRLYCCKVYAILKNLNQTLYPDLFFYNVQIVRIYIEQYLDYSQSGKVEYRKS
jgi:hypothetical protein